MPGSSRGATGLLLRLLPWLALFAAFVLFGVWVRLQMPFPIGCGRDTEIYSFDFLGYAHTLADCRYISYGRFRHPLWGWLTAPVPLFGQRLLPIGDWCFWSYLLVIFAAVGVGCVWLLRRLLVRFGLAPREVFACLCLYLSFSHVWLLAGMPETFGVSMLLALAVLYWAVASPERRERDSFTLFGERFAAPGLGRRVDLVGWIALAVLSGGVTLTQGCKTAIAYAFSGRSFWRRLALVAALGAAAAALVTAVFYFRVRLRVAANPSAPGFESAWHTLVDNFAPSSLPLVERLRLVWVFFSEPLVVRGEPFDSRVITGGYDTFLPPVLLGILYASVAVSVWLNRREPFVRMLGAMFLVDVAIHFAAGWGLGESQLYGGHWMYALPVLCGLLFPRLPSAARRRYFVFLFVLAALLFFSSLHGYFCHDVARLVKG